VETLTLDVRGNNHAAMALYESLGFEAYGRLPDFVAVGDERWDRVLYRLDLRTADWPLRRHGAQPVGAGASTVRSPKRVTDQWPQGRPSIYPESGSPCSVRADPSPGGPTRGR
jgi:hypothetical protein